MKKIGVITVDRRPDVQYFCDFMVKKFEGESVDVWFESEQSYNLTGTDLIVVLGGDGTMLRAFHKFGEMEIPFLGINFGNIGFLCTIEPHDFFEYFSLILDEKYRIEERGIMQVSIIRENQTEVVYGYAFNDVVIKSVLPKVSRQLLHIDGNLFSKYEGDGIICATSMGSTAYSLSAGGSIVEPHLDAIVITPICSRANLMNSMVISTEHKIEILCTDLYPCSILTVDGGEQINLFNNDIVGIQKAGLKVKLIQFNQDRYFKLLQSKLLGAGNPIISSLQ
jgi:Predicted sugar kinase